MATTSFKNTGTITVSGLSFQCQAATNVDSFARSNNSVTAHGLNVQAKVLPAHGWTTINTSSSFIGNLSMPGGTNRFGDSGQTMVGGGNNITLGNVYTTSEVNPTFTVGADDTQVYTNAASGFNGVSWGGGQYLDIPALGSPAGTDTLQTVNSPTQLSVKVDVTNWGANATSGSVRSYIADNSSFSGQTYLSTSDNATVNHTGLTPNKKYWFRGWAQNGGGKNAYIGSTTGVTLASATETSKNVQAASVDFVLAATQGQYATTTKVQYRKTGDSAWTDSSTDSTGTPAITVSGLLPSTGYDYRLVVTTTAGTWTGSTQTLTTKPAVKLISSDGTVTNAIPWVITPDDTKTMAKVNIL